MRELSLHLMDIAENSIAAGAQTIEIIVDEDTILNRLSMMVRDDGKGMDADLLARVVNPFATSRTTRNVGLGIPFLKAAAEACNGRMTIESEPGKGTCLFVEFERDHIDRMPLGDLPKTWLSLLVGNPQIHWIFVYRVDQDEFSFDDQPIKAELEGIPLSEPAVLEFLNKNITDGFQSIVCEKVMS